MAVIASVLRIQSQDNYQNRNTTPKITNLEKTSNGVIAGHAWPLIISMMGEYPSWVVPLLVVYLLQIVVNSGYHTTVQDLKMTDTFQR